MIAARVSTEDDRADSSDPPPSYLGSSAAVSSDRPRDSEDEAAHDVLAAEAFAVPAPDPSLRHRRVVLPDDPSGISQPHDVLAAEEFAMPAASPRTPAPGSPGAVRARRTVTGAVARLLAFLGLRRSQRQD